MITLLRNLIFSDFWLKLFSLVLAILIWLLVSFAIHREVSPTAEQVFIVPVQVTASDSNVRNYQVNPKEVQVTVRGQARKLQSLAAAEIHAQVDLTGDGIRNNWRERV